MISSNSHTIGLKIVGTGVYLPKSSLTAHLAHQKSSAVLKREISLSHFDVEHRYVSENETISEMAALALTSALENAHLKATDLDLLIFGSSMPEQPIPSTSVLLHKKMGLGSTGIPCFDVNSTCTSFLTALEIASSFIQSRRYRRIALVNSEVGSKGINWKELEVASLFADGAAATIVEADPTKKSGIVGILSKTYSDGADLCEIRAGGSKYNIITPPPQSDDYLFRMEGRGVYRLASKYLPQFLIQFLTDCRVGLEEIDWVVPHQASPIAMMQMSRKLGFSEEKFLNIIQTHGNQVSASLPVTLDHCLKNKAKRGDLILLIGTGAGITLSGTLLTY